MSGLVPARPGCTAGPGEHFVPLLTPEEAAAATYRYSDGAAMSTGDLCVIAARSGVWQIVSLGTFDVNGRQWASLVSADHRKRRTAADVSELRLRRPAS